MLCRAHTFICANNLINRICRLMFPLHEDVFQLSWLVTKYSPGFCYAHSTETGTGSNFLHFFRCGRVNERTVQLHVVCYLKSNFCDGQAFLATDMKNSLHPMIFSGVLTISTVFPADNPALFTSVSLCSTAIKLSVKQAYCMLCSLYEHKTVQGTQEQGGILNIFR